MSDIDNCPWCGCEPRPSTYITNSGEVDCLTGDLIEYEFTEYSCCGYTAHSLEEWNSGFANVEFGKLQARVAELEAMIHEATYGRRREPTRSTRGT